MEEVYRSNYENTCADCGHPIKPQVPYHLRKGEKGFERVHNECPEVKDETTNSEARDILP